MGDEALMQFASNSNESSPCFSSKIAKLEARMSGKVTLAAPQFQPPLAAPPVKFDCTEDLPDTSYSTDTDDDSMEDTFLIRPTVQKQHRLLDGEQGSVDDKGRSVEAAGAKSEINDETKKKQKHGRGRPATGKVCSARFSGQSRYVASNSTNLPANSEIEDPMKKVGVIPKMDTIVEFED